MYSKLTLASLERYEWLDRHDGQIVVVVVLLACGKRDGE